MPSIGVEGPTMNQQRLIGGLVLALTLCGAARAADPGDAEAGKRLALQTCTACHRVATEADQASGPKLVMQAPSFLSMANDPTATAALAHDFLMVTHKSLKTPPDMPAMLLSDDEARDLAAYIMSLRKPPQAPPAG
jgi:mono/diheme cytochrome c family protein